MNTQVKPSADLMRSVSFSFPDQRPDDILERLIYKTWSKIIDFHYPHVRSFTYYFGFWSEEEKCLIDAFVQRFKEAGFDVEKGIEDKGFLKGRDIIRIKW